MSSEPPKTNTAAAALLQQSLRPATGLGTPCMRVGECLRVALRAIVCGTGIDRRNSMPEIVVYAVGNRPAEQKKALCKDITDAMVKNY